MKVEPAELAAGGWRITHGIARVTMARGRLQAYLTLDPDIHSGADIRLEGVIEAHHVSATETVIGTDANPQRIHGTIEKESDGPVQAERIILSDDGIKSGLVRFIGVSRSVRR